MTRMFYRRTGVLAGFFASACAAVLLVGAEACAQGTAVDAGSLDGLAPTGPAVSGETYDPVTNRLPDDGFGWLRDLDRELSGLRAEGYPKPDVANLYGYNTLTLEALSNRLKGIGDPCKKAVFAKLYLDANQDEFTEMTAARIGAEILAIEKIPNKWKIADILLEKALGHTVPGLAQASIAEDVLAVIDVAQRYSQGSGAGWRGRWGLAAYESATGENWSAERIARERADRQDEMEMLGEVIRALSDQMVLDGQEIERGYLARDTEIKSRARRQLAEIDADEAVDGESHRRIAWQKANPEYAQPGGTWYRPGEVIEGRVPLEEARQRYLAEAPRYYSEARQGVILARTAEEAASIAQYKTDLAIMSSAFNKAISEKLARIAQLQAEAQALGKYAAPVNAGDCEKLRKPPKPVPVDKFEAAVIDKIRKLDKARFEALMENAGVRVPDDFYRCLCAALAQGGVGGGWTIKEGACYSVGVLGGLSRVDMSGGDSAKAWQGCLDRVPVPWNGLPDGARMHDILIGRLRELPGRAIAESE